MIRTIHWVNALTFLRFLGRSCLKVRGIKTILLAIVALFLCPAVWAVTGSYAKSQLTRVDSLTAAAEYEDAAELLETLDAKLFPDSVLLLRKGQIYRQIDDVESRRKSVHALQTLVEIYPTEPRFYIELAKTLQAQTFDEDAKIQLRKAITLNPADETPYILLSDIYASDFFYNAWTSEATLAESVLEELLRCVPNSRKGLCKLASLQALRGKIGAALGNGNRALAMDSNVVDVNLVLGYVQYELRHYEMSQLYFGRALAHMTRFDKWAYSTIECVLPPEAAADYICRQPEVRDSIAREFWRVRDSDPTTEANERLLEHYCRVWESNLYFGTPENGGVGWRTAMGETLVRMGRPDVRRRELKEVHKSKNGHFIDESRVWTWSYGSTDIPCSFAFLDRYFKNDYIYPIIGYDNRLSGMDQASGWIANAVFNQRPEQTSLLRSSELIAVGTDVYQFRSDDGQTAIVVDMTVPVRDLAVDSSAGQASAKFSVRRSLRSSQDEVIWQRAYEERVDLQARERRQDKDVWRDVFTEEARPGTYHLAVACEQPRDNRLGIASNSIELQKFSEGLALSDLFLTSDPVLDPKLGAVWKGEHSGSVTPSKEFSPSEPLTVYFEIYNLPTDVYRQTSYELSYTLQLVKPTESGVGSLVSKVLARKRESITTSLHEIGMNRSLARALTIDTGELRAGSYVLTMKLTDLIHSTSVSKTTTLVLTD